LPRLAASLVSVTLCLGCSRKPSSDHDEKPELQSEEKDFPEADFTVKKGMTDGLFTWIDQDGSFQIADKPEDVPAHGRSTVRVVKEGHSPGGPEHVYVVDLTALDQKSKFDVRAITRTEWEVLGKKQRDDRVAALVPPPTKDDPSPADLGVDAIVYGADWCKPCHLAEDYLKKRGARVVKKDIEEDPSAAAEMRRKLKSAGMSGSSIPVLDVGGTILRGFSESSVESALKRAAAKTD
jgi:glutaredoxin